MRVIELFLHGFHIRSRVILVLLSENTLCFVIQTYITISIKATKEIFRIFTYVKLHQKPQDAGSPNEVGTDLVDPSFVFLVVGLGLVTVASSKWS